MNIDDLQNHFEDNIINIEKISGGVTNIIFKITTDKNIFILRIYGEKSEIFINRKLEKEIMDYLCNYNISPKIIKETDSFRIEEYFEGDNNIEPFKYQIPLCTVLKKIHNIPTKKNFPVFWDRFFYWQKEAGFPYKKEIDEILRDIDNIDFKYWAEEVLGHGDLTLGNILYDNNEIRLIDYEYSCILPRGFDIANHLCEYGGLDTEKYTYPEDNIRIKLIKNYIEGIIEYRDTFLLIIDKYSLISHYYWGCWSIIQSKISSINFNYHQYGNNRFQMFLHYKKLFISSSESFTIDSSE